MANKATAAYLAHPEELKLKFQGGQLKLPITPQSFCAVKSADESMLLCMKDGPFVVISAAGMLSGGRVLHHLKARLPGSENIVLFVGYQAEGTKGRLLVGGLPVIRLHHQDVVVEAEIVSIDSLSAHADSSELVDWVSKIECPPQKVFLNHGETQALRALKYRLKYELGLNVSIASKGVVNKM